jgi:hypothetical protein
VVGRHLTKELRTEGRTGNLPTNKKEEEEEEEGRKKKKKEERRRRKKEEGHYYNYSRNCLLQN